MSYLKILNLQFNRYRLTTTIEDNTIYGFYCPNEEDTELALFSGEQSVLNVRAFHQTLE